MGRELLVPQPLDVEVTMDTIKSWLSYATVWIAANPTISVAIYVAFVAAVVVAVA